MSLETSPGHRERSLVKHNPYKTYSPGDNLSFLLNTVRSDGSVFSSENNVIVRNLYGGGFFGEVIFPHNEQYVIKTPLPDPWHHLWRMVNWHFKEFPAQSDELAARLEHLSTRLIHLVIPALSNDKFMVPNSYGYTKLKTGFAQVVERMSGRGPRYDLSEDEFVSFRQAQQELLDLGTRLGLEQIGQIHPDNPYAMANLWYDDKRKNWIWLDTIPAIPHNGWIWPAFYFKFHKDVRKRMGERQTTFNRIHTDIFRNEIEQYRDLFTQENYEQITKYLEIYDRTYISYEGQRSNRREFGSAGYAAKEVVSELLTKNLFYKLIADPNFRSEKIENIRTFKRDKQYRADYFNRHFILRGIEKAYKEGVISEKEWVDAWTVIDSFQSQNSENQNLIITLLGLQFYYLITSRIFNTVEVATYLTALFSEDKLPRWAAGFFIGWVLPCLVRALSTHIVGMATNSDLSVARKISALPKVGGILAPTAQALYELRKIGSKSDDIWHFTIRNFIAAISAVSPSGGWNTELEGRLWKAIGARLEKLGQQKNEINTED